MVNRLAEREADLSLSELRLDPERARWYCMPVDRVSPPALLQGRRLVVDVDTRGLLLLPLGLAGHLRLDVDLGSPAERLTYEIGYAEVATAGGSGPVVVIRTRVSPTPAVAEIQVVTHDPGPVRVGACDAWVEPGVAAGCRRRTSRWTRRWPATIPRSRIPCPSRRGRAGVLVTWVGPRAVLAVAGDRGAAEDLHRRWEDVREEESRSWADVAGRLQIRTPDPRLTRQAAYSLHSSLFSRSVDEDGHDIFLHGRRDRGYADTAHLHHSYQMHLPALAAGETASVRDELLAFVRLQRADGWIERAPRPVAGSSTYVGRYTGAHLLLAVRRYLAWTGDGALLDDPVASRIDPVPRTVRERVSLAADDLLAHRFRGLVAPCGWADAWNPAVRAQGQISATAVLALRAWAEVLEAVDGPVTAEPLVTAADELAAAARAVLLDPESGLVAEHVFDDAVRGTPDDFYAHAQIWAALAGIATDGRALDLVADRCLGHGVSIAPESAFDQDYVAASTDSQAALPLDSTATWLLASWPEVTHLYALAELHRGNADAALAAVVGQLPETLHALDPACPPWFYAEKYLAPGTRPWLCTWAGDPSLLEVVLDGSWASGRPSLGW